MNQRSDDPQIPAAMGVQSDLDAAIAAFNALFVGFTPNSFLYVHDNKVIDLPAQVSIAKLGDVIALHKVGDSKHIKKWRTETVRVIVGTDSATINYIHHKTREPKSMYFVRRSLVAAA